MKKLSAIILSMIFVFALAEEADAQRGGSKKRGSSSRDKAEVVEDTRSFTENLSYEIGFGNIGGSSGFGFSNFSMSFRPTVGYKLHERITAGLGAKWYYDFYNFSSVSDISLNSIGGIAFVKGKITNDIYLRANFEYMNYQDLILYQDLTSEKESDTFLSPLIGAGYSSGVGNWKFGIELLFITDNGLRDFANRVVDYWVVASYRF